MSNEEFKVIYSYVYTPSSGAKQTERPKRTTIHCSKSDQCELYKNGQCLLISFLSGSCPYGKYTRVEGPTRRAKSFSTWCKDEKERYGEIHGLKSASKGLFRVGDLMYVNYSQVNFDKPRAPFLKESHFFNSAEPFMKAEDFTVETVKHIINHRPQAVMGGEITSYQKQEVPHFLKQLLAKYPDMYNAVITDMPERALTNDQLSNVGRKALLITLKPNIGEFVDIHGGKWTWDGEYVTSHNSKASFMLIDRFSELKIKPSDSAEVKITSDDQVTDQTVFKD